MATPAIPSAELAQLMEVIEGWEAVQLTDYLQTAGLMLIVADYLQTLPDEIELMWPSTGLTLPKFLFFTLRYFIFAQHSFLTYFMRLEWATPSRCQWTFFSVSMTSCIILLASEAVLYVRVYALSGRNRKTLAFLLFLFLALSGSTFALLVVFGKQIVFIELPIPICMPVALPAKLLGGTYVITFCSLLSVMLIMVFLARSKHKGLDSTLFAVFYRDGLFYFVCLSAFAIFNGIMGFIAPVKYKFLFIQFETDVHAILAARLLLHLRGQAHRDPSIPGADSTGDTYYLSDIGLNRPRFDFRRKQEAKDSVHVTVSKTVS